MMVDLQKHDSNGFKIRQGWKKAKCSAGVLIVASVVFHFCANVFAEENRHYLAAGIARGLLTSMFLAKKTCGSSLAKMAPQGGRVRRPVLVRRLLLNPMALGALTLIPFFLGCELEPGPSNSFADPDNPIGSEADGETSIPDGSSASDPASPIVPESGDDQETSQNPPLVIMSNKGVFQTDMPLTELLIGQVSIQNTTDEIQNWAAMADVPWVALSQTSGTVGEAETQGLSFQITDSAPSIPGRYIATITYSNSEGYTYNQQVVLEVLQPASKKKTPSKDMPIGIPDPSFGANESHMNYADDFFDYGNGLESYRLGSDGPYTHYIDNANRNATDVNNPFGTPDRPRKTLPLELSPGSVVEIHRGPYESANGQLRIISNGTAERPVFFRGIKSEPAQIGAQLQLYGHHAVFENLLSTSSIVFRSGTVGCHHMAIRNTEIAGDGTEGSGGTISTQGAETLPVHDILIYRNHVHDGGNRTSEGERDQHGISVKSYTEDLWALENDVYNMAGDSIQINAGESFSARRIYVGYNEFHDNRENAVDIKQSEDVIISQNTAYSFKPTSSSHGNAMVVHYGARRVWFLYNEIFNSQYGISSTDSWDLYIMGNIIHDIFRIEKDHAVDTIYSRGTAIQWYNTRYTHVSGNTIYNAANGIAAKLGKYAPDIVNNIISTMNTEDDGFHLSVYGQGIENTVINGNIFYQPSVPVRIRWGKDFTDVNGFKAVMGCEYCMETDPLFVNPEKGDFHLSSQSPALDAAVPDTGAADFERYYGMELKQDFENAARIKGTAQDIGPYELPQ